jgi:D-threo-aldose 1-dehydrogenase
MQKSMNKRKVGRTALSVTELGVGGAPFGNMFRAMDTDGVVATVKAAIESGIRYFDTAPSYGFGLSETRLGEALKPFSRESIVISSKVGYSLVTLLRCSPDCGISRRRCVPTSNSDAMLCCDPLNRA